MNRIQFTRFVKIIKVVLIQNQIVGLITFSVKNGKFEPSKIRILYNIVATLLVLPVTLFGVYNIFMSEHQNIFKTTSILLLLTYSTYVLAVWIYGILHSSKIIDLLMKLIELDGKLYSLGLHIDHDNEKKHILHRFIGRVIFLVAVVTSCACFIQSHGTFDFISHIAYVIFLGFKSATCFQTIVLIRMIKRRVEILNDHVKKIIKCSHKSRFLFISLCRTCDLHHRLSKFIRQFNETFGLILLFVFGASFIVIVISAFYIEANLQANEIEWTRVVMSLLMAVPSAADVVHVCNICYTTVEEVNRTGELIHKIKTEDHDVIDEIEMFSLQITNHEVEFSAAKYFPIDHSLLFTIVGGVTTYIIILIQLSSSLLK